MSSIHAKFTRKVTVDVYDLYAVIEVDHERKDIQEFLTQVENGSINGSKFPEKQIYWYLKNWDCWIERMN